MHFQLFPLPFPFPNKFPLSLSHSLSHYFSSIYPLSLPPFPDPSLSLILFSFTFTIPFHSLSFPFPLFPSLPLLVHNKAFISIKTIDFTDPRGARSPFSHSPLYMPLKIMFLKTGYF